MSEPIPESIPTSADPRSKRPAKKRALSPHSQTATQISSLFSKPEQAIANISSALTPAPRIVQQPPEIVQNVQGSSAGAGSGEFHVYKASRRREYERLRDMEAEVEKEKENLAWEKEKREREERDREITKRKREKRERLKQKKGKSRKGVDQGIEIDRKAGNFLHSVTVQNNSEVMVSQNQPSGIQTEEQAHRAAENGMIIHDDDD